MRQVLISKGRAIIAEVPAPKAGIGEILVKVEFSCLSLGTEMSGIKSSGIPIWRKVLNKPEKALATIQLAKNIGVSRTWKLIKRYQEAASPSGYSASGVVVAVGEGVKGIACGERVACAGSKYAHHSEYIRVPINLCTLLPENVSHKDASTVTLGAIALQGIRRAKPQIGEVFVVMGLGVLGQLTVQILKANGCRVIAIDIDEGRVKLAQTLGANIGIHASDAESMEEVAILTDGYGADGVIITAATTSDSVVSNAFKVTRKKGRVVLVGDVGLNLRRSDFYEKEIDFLVSTSYGPGRYDSNYEESGLDYPISYVRWTENRNMAEYLKLISEGKIHISALVSSTYALEDADNAYESARLSESDRLLILLDHSKSLEYRTKVKASQKKLQAEEKIKIALIGAGAFAKSTHLPNLEILSDRYTLRAIGSRNGHIASSLAKEFGAEYSTTSYQDILDDEEINSVLISTRHHLHAEMALEAMVKGKNVLVEKPLAINQKQLDMLRNFYETSTEKNLPVLMTGYNRRHSIYARKIKEFLQNRNNPFIVNYRVNAGYISRDSWVHGSEGGGRNIGEACHMYDLFMYLADAEVTELSAHSISPKGGYYQKNDNFIATLKFSDGSLANLIYTSMGSNSIPKEQAEIYCEGKMAILNDYKSLEIYGQDRVSFKTTIQEKGLREELLAFADAIKNGFLDSEMYLQLQVAQIAINIEEIINGRS